MTDVASPVVTSESVKSGASKRRNLQILASARVEKLTQLILPPGHAPVLDVMALTWFDGVEVGFQMTDRRSLGLTETLAEVLYDELDRAELCHEYEEFPELDDPDFQDLACGRVQKLSRGFHPVGHPEVTWDMAEIWTDGVAAALRISRDQGQRPA